MKPDPHNNMDDTFIAELLDGARAAHVARAHPKRAKDVAAYERLLSRMKSVGEEMPSPEGLRRALRAVPNEAPRMQPSPFSYIALFTTYRAALVLPLVVIVLVASGWFLLPGGKKGDTTVAEAPGQHVADGAPQTAAAPVRASFAKMAAQNAGGAAAPVDPTLSNIFASEVMQNQSTTTLSDTGDIAAFSGVYNANEL